MKPSRFKPVCCNGCIALRYACRTVCMLLMAAAVSCAAERSSTMSPQETGSARPSSSGNVLRLRTWQCMDEQGIGGEVFRMLIPAEWKAESRVVWEPQVPSAPASISFRVWNPSGDECLEGFPRQAMFWTDNPGLLQTFPPGSRYFGCEVRRPVPIAEALERIVFPRYRKGASEVSVLQKKALPEVIRALGLQAGSPGGGLQYVPTAALVRMEYRLDGKAYTEDLVGVCESLRIPVPTMLGSFTNENWTLTYLVGMRAAAGKLDAQSKLFAAMTSSFRINREWFNRYVQLVELLIQGEVQRIRMAGEFSRLLARTSAEISEDRMRLWESRQAAYDRISESFSDYMRDVDAYRDPDGNVVKLPSGYRNAWVNGLGEYVLSDSESFNPNIGSNQNWQPLQRK